MAILAGISLIVAFVLISCVALNLIFPPTVSISGTLVRIREGVPYRYVGRAYPWSPIIELVLYFSEPEKGRWKKVEVILQNFIDKRFKGDVTVLLMDRENNVIALARRSIVVEYRERLALDLPLNWKGGKAIRDVIWGKVTAEFIAF